MNYMKDIAKNFVAKKNNEQVRETRAERQPTNRGARSPRVTTDNKNKPKREAKSMAPALRNLRPQTAQPSTFGSPLKRVIEKKEEQKAAKESNGDLLLTPKPKKRDNSKTKEDVKSPVKKPKK